MNGVGERDKDEEERYREREREREKEEYVESVEFPNAPSIQGFDESFQSFNSLSLSLSIICLYGNFICFFFYNKAVFVLRVVNCIYIIIKNSRRWKF